MNENWIELCNMQKIREKNPEWSEEQCRAEFNRIHDEYMRSKEGLGE